jgi:hypothetical protein
MFIIYSQAGIVHETNDYNEAVHYSRNLCQQTLNSVSVMSTDDNENFDEIYAVAYNKCNGRFIEVEE